MSEEEGKRRQDLNGDYRGVQQGQLCKIHIVEALSLEKELNNGPVLFEVALNICTLFLLFTAMVYSDNCTTILLSNLFLIY